LHGRDESSHIGRTVDVAFADPHGFYSRGGHKVLIRLLEANPDAAVSAPDPDQLEQLFISAQSGSDPVALLMYGLLLAIQSRNSAPEQSCDALAQASSVLFERLKEPELALTLARIRAQRPCPGGREAMHRIEAYLKNDHSVAVLLAEPWYDKTEDERLAYARSLEHALGKHPQTTLRLDASRRIGDVYYDLEKHRVMRRWYREVLAIDSSLARQTPIGYRIEVADKRIIRENLHVLFLLLYLMIGLYLLGRISRSWRTFDITSAGRSLGICLVLYALVVVAVYLIDSRLFPTTLSSVTYSGEFEYPLTKPIVAFGALDRDFSPESALMLVVGFAPVLLAVVYTSFRRGYSRPVLLAMVLLTACTAWSHFVVATAFDAAMSPSAIFNRGRLYYNGELEELLLENPRKVLRANPELMDADNVDLRIFVDEHFPDGLPR
jgi:hypothetical protein